MSGEHFPEVSTDALTDPPLHQAACECGWKGRKRRDWSKACDEADWHAARHDVEQQRREP